ncbi:LysR family transcriptional regulator [Paraferrimonas sedimenticola]|uniref:LysR family transcriptional regulator n=1 Tax=Paraferrimonas sedimenticola TaxID=375674 RepID=A0AA37RZU4_9GAMM|nr:LysR family transcriptional regulator [Paraferrimonas sedimenticola]GLP98123.1 LysR family transcriptional regulator [Paraferrimonas sedimenticola]
MVELRHLKTLIALKESGSLAAAAGKRFVTQSALSHQIKELETRINAPLFIRKSKPLRFTPEGQKLVDLAECILPMVAKEEAQLKLGLDKVEQKLTIGVACFSCYRWLQPVIEAFSQRYPDIKVELTAKYQFESLQALENGDVDLVITSDSRPSDAVKYQHLFDYDLELMMSPRHPLAQKAFIKPQDLEGETLISYPVPLQKLDLVSQFMAPSGVVPGPQKQCELTMMLLQRVASGDGVCALPAWSKHDGMGMHLTSRQLGTEGLQRPLYAALPQSAVLNAATKELLELVCAHAVQAEKQRAA